VSMLVGTFVIHRLVYCSRLSNNTNSVIDTGVLHLCQISLLTFRPSSKFSVKTAITKNVPVVISESHFEMCSHNLPV